MRFPPILRIDAEMPAIFQDRIRHKFPLYEEVREGEQLPLELVKELPKELRNLIPNIGGNKMHDFKSLDGQWTVRLSRDFLALTASKYTVWKTFWENFKLPFDALGKLYKPSIYTRVGLRYRNVIVRSELGIEDVAWSDLINPELAGVISAKNIEPHVQRFTQLIGLELPHIHGEVNIRHGLVNIDGGAEVSYLIDSDFFAGDIQGKEKVHERLRGFNQEAGRIFRWGITAKLRDSMEPIAVD